LKWKIWRCPAFREVYSALRIPKSACRKVLLKIHFHGKLQKVEGRVFLLDREWRGS
jgi:hypothetical protein